MAVIRVTVSPEGRKTMVVEGAVGHACEKMTAPYLEAAGLDQSKVERVMRAEYVQETNKLMENI